MTTYRPGNHHGVTINREGDGFVCARPGHDCARGHIVAVVTNDDWDLAERIAWLLTHIRTPADRPHEDTLPQLTDRIIDAGPYTNGQVLPPELVREIFKTHELNALRDELIELRQLRAAAEARERYEIAACGWNYGGAHLEMTCKRCGQTWTFDNPDDGPSELDRLAELVRRADEHTEGHQ